MHDFKVVMLGARKVGKTTLLAATWDRFKEGIFTDTRLRLNPEGDTAGQLEMRLEELKKIPQLVLSKSDYQNETLALGDVKRFGLSHTDEPVSYEFTLAVGQKDPEIRLTFKDFPGEDILKLTNITKELEDSNAALVAIDAPALMESSGDWDWLHGQHNKPSLIATALQAYKKSSGPRLVIFVPVRCETYLRHSEDAKELLKRVKQGYREAFEVLAANESNIAVAITPVQTVGTLYFHSLQAESDPNLEPTNSDYVFAFRKIRRTDMYRPQDTEQPLRYLLRFCLSRVVLDKSEARLKDLDNPDTGFFKAFFLLGKDLFADRGFKSAVESFAQKSKNVPPFQVVQGHNLLGY